mgnify:CR=1 FL=1
MKTRLLTLIAALLLASASWLGAQPYTTTWPYLYSDFQDGVIYMTGGQKIYHKLNVHLMKGRLHYLDNDVVKEAFAGDIFYAEIGPESDKFMVVNGDMMKVVAEQPGGFVADHITGDFDALLTGTGAYGMQANTEAIQSYSSLNIQGAVNVNHMLLLQEKHEGREFDLKHQLFIVTGGKVYRAVRSDIEKSLPKEDRADFKAYVKQHKIKWKDPEKLLVLVDFLSKS